MQQLHSDLWVTESPLRFFGAEIGARMTVARLPNSELWLHSPVAATPELVREVEALGPVACLVAPNRLHHLFVGEWQRTCPEASTFVAPGLDTKRPDLAVAGVLSEQAEPVWKDVLDQVVVAGFPFANEVVFFHRPSATLILTDLAFHFGPDSSLPVRLLARLSGTFGQVAPTLLERLLVRDRAAFRGSLERILAWPFERVIVSHGDVCETGGRDQLIRGYHWVLGDGG